MAKVGIIILTNNRPDLSKRVLASVINQSYQDWELFIINNLIGMKLPYPYSGFEHNGKHYNNN